MKRREAIEKTSWILKSAIFTPGLVSAIQSCQPKVKDTHQLLVLNEQQYQLTKSLADTIVPRTETPSASDVQVPEFVDLLLLDVFEEKAVNHLINGLNNFDIECKEATGKLFAQMDNETANSYLKNIDMEVMSKQYEADIPFYFTFKQLVITIYFSSEQGVKQNLNYQPIPGPYQGDIILGPAEKIMVGNQM